MIKGLGIDIVKTERIREVYARFGRKFARRILAEDDARGQVIGATG